VNPFKSRNALVLRFRRYGIREEACLGGAELFDLDELDGFAAWTLNHHGACLAEFVRLLEEFDAFFLQFSDPEIEITYAQTDVIRQMSAGADKGAVSLAFVPHEGYVVEQNAGGWFAHGAFFFEGGPTRLAALHLAVRFGVRHLPSGGRRHSRIEVLPIPELRAVRVFLVHMHVIETLNRHISLVLHDGPVRTLQVCEAGASKRLQAGAFRFRDLRLRQTQHSTGARPRIAADKNISAILCGIEREKMDFFPLLIRFKVLTDVDNMPAEMPNGCLWFSGGWCITFEKSTYTLPAFNAGKPATVVFVVLGNCLK
jgi:hypothetical protein